MWPDVNQTEPGDDVGDLKGPNVNHDNMPNSEPGTGAAEPGAVSRLLRRYGNANQSSYTVYMSAVSSYVLLKNHSPPSRIIVIYYKIVHKEQ